MILTIDVLIICAKNIPVDFSFLNSECYISDWSGSVPCFNLNTVCNMKDHKWCISISPVTTTITRWTCMSGELRPLPSLLFYKFQLSNADQLQSVFVLPLRCSTIMKSFILPVSLTLNLSGVNSLSVWIFQTQRPCFSYHIYSPWMSLILASSFIKST